jgi:MarR family transcriptional regulator, organic hydroperoxide resistance regulator
MAAMGTVKMSKGEVAAEVWRLLVTFSWAHRSRFIGMAREIGLTPGDLKAMFVLSTDKPVPMGTLAQACDCDASTATWMVDRLEEQGLAERSALPADRRVKAVALTQKGAKVKAELSERLYEPPDALLAVDRATLETLRDALQKLPLDPPPHPHGDDREAAAHKSST